MQFGHLPTSYSRLPLIIRGRFRRNGPPIAIPDRARCSNCQSFCALDVGPLTQLSASCPPSKMDYLPRVRPTQQAVCLRFPAKILGSTKVEGVSGARLDVSLGNTFLAFYGDPESAQRLRFMRINCSLRMVKTNLRHRFCLKSCFEFAEHLRLICSFPRNFEIRTSHLSVGRESLIKAVLGS